jgi:ADP-ribosylglycohydrolase
MLDSQVDLRERVLGCLIGCAVGDALGAPYEGLWPHQIPESQYLLADFVEIDGYPKGQYTDDTQLSVASVESIVARGDLSLPHLARSIARLWKNESVVGPGGACTHAALTFMRTGDWTTCGAATGQAGNGTAMRTAVLGFLFLDEQDRLPGAVADALRITHQDTRSIAGGIGIAKAAQLQATDQADTPEVFCATIADAMDPFEHYFASQVRELPTLLGKRQREAMECIAWAGMARPEFKDPIITPFVIPTVLASLWCLLQHLDSWSKAVTRALRLGGDVDTLGAIVGALAGARLGVSAIPSHLVSNVLDSEKLQALAARYHSLVVSKQQK